MNTWWIRFHYHQFRPDVSNEDRLSIACPLSSIHIVTGYDLPAPVVYVNGVRMGYISDQTYESILELVDRFDLAALEED